ncbi:MAG: CPBP family intramembrane metalloprotease [Chloroflexi bacterium]|nr:MAG: CPBP family intramembrane metalloprotease [Chloroflexota bacterium]
MDQNRIDRKRISIYIAFAFGVAWLAALGIYLTGGLAKSPYTILLLTVGYMGAPALAHLLTRLITREGWQNLYLRPNFRQGWLYWVICWIAPAIFTFIGMAIFFVLFPQYFDPSLEMVQKIMQSASGSTGQPVPTVDPWMIVISQTITALLIAPVINAIPILGEEFGWRAYLQPKLMPLGGRKTMLWMGIIWGLWHAPIIAMGHNYGLEYPGAPWLGILAMTWFTFVFGTFLGWATLRAGSVWPAVIGHGALNGIAGIYLFFIQGNPNLVLGPVVPGFIGSLGIAVVALIILLRRDALKPQVQ